MLTTLDDTLWHQLPTTFDHVGTSDPRFYDRFWFACYERGGDAALQITMGAYRNMNVMDIGVVVTHAGRQHNVRASRSLGREISMACGPLTVTPVVPLQEFELVLAEGVHGVSARIHWEGIAPAAEERHHFERSRGRVVEDYARFDQIGRADGWVEIAGKRLTLDNWWACRDHSWGVRPRTGIREPVTGPVADLSKEGFVFALLFFSTDDLVGHVQFSRRGEQAPYYSGDLRRTSDGSVRLATRVELHADLHPGTRRFKQCRLTVQMDDGGEVTLDCTAIGSSIAMQGLGYSGGFNDHKGLGVWRGEQHLEHDIYDVSHPADIVYPDGKSNPHFHRIQPVSVVNREGGTKANGTGSLTLMMSGRLPQYGLE
jgi:hypothetical protein